jgi:hypothetical protein
MKEAVLRQTSVGDTEEVILPANLFFRDFFFLNQQ